MMHLIEFRLALMIQLLHQYFYVVILGQRLLQLSFIRMRLPF